ncbi:hypothetical protein C8J57DRAFT_1491248 [Mycena rebaudengoi]|nr:hypothetical protein C8J57DRAFT_1491248 [Mycena rebaudengoi]
MATRLCPALLVTATKLCLNAASEVVLECRLFGLQHFFVLVPATSSSVCHGYVRSSSPQRPSALVPTTMPECARPAPAPAARLFHSPFAVATSTHASIHAHLLRLLNSAPVHTYGLLVSPAHLEFSLPAPYTLVPANALVLFYIFFLFRFSTCALVFFAISPTRACSCYGALARSLSVAAPACARVPLSLLLHALVRVTRFSAFVCFSHRPPRAYSRCHSGCSLARGRFLYTLSVITSPGLAPGLLYLSPLHTHPCAASFAPLAPFSP